MTRAIVVRDAGIVAGAGYATEAAQVLLDDVFDRGLPEVWCGMFVGNEPSRKVAERLGLPFIGVCPDPWYEAQSRLYRLTRSQWQDRRGPGAPPAREARADT